MLREGDGKKSRTPILGSLLCERGEGLNQEPGGDGAGLKELQWKEDRAGAGSGQGLSGVRRPRSPG